MDNFVVAKVNGKDVKIPKAELENLRQKLKCTPKEAVATWLEDRDYICSPETQAMVEKTKGQRSLNADSRKPRKKSDTPKTVKVSDQKKELFSTIVESLQQFGENVEIIKENKLILVHIDEKVFKIDLIEQRTSKK